HSTSDDPSVISPAAEQAVRKSVLHEYAKSMAADHNRSQNSVDSIQRSYSRRLKDTVVSDQDRENDIQRQNAADRNAERTELLGHIEDTEFRKKQALKNQELDHERETDSMNRHYAVQLDGQRREYEDILAAQKN